MQHKDISTTKSRGDYGETVACRYLQDRGYVIHKRNYMPRYGVKRGEIDIIAKKDGALHFIEVKTRFLRLTKSAFNDLPEAQITRTKLRALMRTVESYLSEQKLENITYHIDAIAVTVTPSTSNGKSGAQVRFLQDIFL